MQVVLALLTAIIMLTMGVFFYLRQNPDLLGPKLARQISERTGLECGMGVVSAVLFPLPALSVTNIELSSPRAAVSIDYLTFRPALLPLLLGDLAPAQVTLLRPEITLKAQNLPAKPASTKISSDAAVADDNRRPPDAFSIPQLPEDCEIIIMNGSFRKIRQSGDFFVSGVNARLNFNGKERLADINGLISGRDLDLPFNVMFNTDERRPGTIFFKKMILGLGKDSAGFFGELSLPDGYGSAFSLEGRVEVNNIDLPRWFSFGRGLPDGLQHALGSVRGAFDLRMNAHSLLAENLQAEVGKFAFKGLGKVENFSKPLIFIDASSSGVVRLEDILPESAGKNVPSRRYGHDPLDSGNGASKADKGPGLGYDINLSAAGVDYWRFKAARAAFRCTEEPGGTALHFKIGDLAGGTGTARLLLPEESVKGKTPRKVLRASLKSFNLDAFTRTLMGASGGNLISGKGDLNANVSFYAGSLRGFLASLDGPIKLNSQNGKFTALGTPFSRLEIQAGLRGQEKAGAGSDSVSCVGDWQVSAQGENWHASLRVDGPATFSSRAFLPARGQNLSGTVQFNKNILSGRFSFDSATGSVGVDNGRIKAFDADFSGSAQLFLAGEKLPEAKGRIVVDCPSLRRTLSHFKIDPGSDIPAKMLQRSRMAADFSANAQSLTLTSVEGRIDATTFQGKLSGNWKARPLWNFDLKAGTLDADEYRGKPVARAGKGVGDSKPRAGDLPIKLLRDFDLSGMLKIDALRVHKLVMLNAVVPMELKNGLLQCSPMESDFYGARSRSGLRAEVGPGEKPALKTHLSFDVKRFDLLAMTMERDLGFVLGGKADFAADVAGQLRSFSDFPLNFNATSRIYADNGFMQNRSPGGRLEGNRTVFHSVSATTMLDKGVIRNNDLLLHGESLSASGQGRVDLKAETINYTLRVSMYNLPEFPVHFTGSLNNPKRDVRAGQAITGALNSFGSGVLDVVGGIIRAPLKLFR